MSVYGRDLRLAHIVDWTPSPKRVFPAGQPAVQYCILGRLLSRNHIIHTVTMDTVVVIPSGQLARRTSNVDVPHVLIAPIPCCVTMVRLTPSQRNKLAVASAEGYRHLRQMIHTSSIPGGNAAAPESVTFNMSNATVKGATVVLDSMNWQRWHG